MKKGILFSVFLLLTITAQYAQVTIKERVEIEPGEFFNPASAAAPNTITLNLQWDNLLVGGLVYEYHIKNLNAGFNTKILVQSPAELMISGKFDTNEGSYIGPQDPPDGEADTATISSKDIVFYIGGINGTSGNLASLPKAAKIGINNKIKANFYVPNGTLWIMMNSEAEGAFIAKDISVGVGTKITLNSSFRTTD